MSTTTASVEAIFHPVEHAILSDWLGRARPDCARDIDLDDHWEEATEPTDDPWAPRSAHEGNHGRLWESANGGCSEFFNALDNAVARICLENVQGALPQWSARRLDGADVVARRYDSVLERRVKLLPRLILEINWATSGPGCSWPEAYSRTYIPYYDVCIVTASQDSPDVQGHTDEAIAWFCGKGDVAQGVEDVVKGFWTLLRDTYEQQHWEHLFYEGLVTAGQAWRWGAEVWGEEEGEDDVDGEEVDGSKGAIARVE
jgi:hypothetical protein